MNQLLAVTPQAPRRPSHGEPLSHGLAGRVAWAAGPGTQ